VSIPGPDAPPVPRRGRIAVPAIATGLILIMLTAAGLLAANPQRVADQLAVWQYEPSDVITRYADRTAMSDEGRFLFYASRPAIAEGARFDDLCASGSEDVGVLGCYVHADRSILLFDVTDERLDGMEEVVAAHEMLHAAWDRLGDDERRRLGELLEAEVAKRADDEHLAETLAFYDEREPGQRANELHSIIGTEYADLAPELEQHYARYFTDRTAVVALHEASNAVFLQQQAAIDDLIARLDALTAGIDADYVAYNGGYDQLNADILEFNARVESGEVRSQAQYDREVAGFEARQAELDALFGSIQARADEHAGLVAQLEELNAEVDELNASINIQPREEQPAG
jgi:hypothetical protein